jgi:ABC-2 type transport system ATP-binding protein
VPSDKQAFSQLAGVLFPDDGLYLRLSPQANLTLYCQLHGLPSARALEILAAIGMADQARSKIDKLPTGLQRRLAFGRCLLHNPRVLILFEPFTRCDEATIQLIGALMEQSAQNGASLLVLADDTANLEQICSRIYVLDHGRLSQSEVSRDEGQGAMPFKIPVRLEDKVRLVNPGDILYAEAEGNYASLHTSEGRMPTRFSLSELEQRLSRSGFFRAHRAYLVNLQHVREVIPYTRNSYSLRLTDPEGTEIPLSRSAAAELRNLLDY